MRDVEPVLVDHVVDLLEADVLDDPAPARRRDGIEQPPDRSPAPGLVDVGDVQSEHGVGEHRQDGEQGGDEKEPEDPRRCGDGELRGEQRRHPQGDRVHDDEERAHGREDQPAGEGDDDRPDECVDDRDHEAGEQEGPCAGGVDRDDVDALSAEGERLGDRQEPEKGEHDEQDQGIEDDTDHQPAHLSHLALLNATDGTASKGRPSPHPNDSPSRVAGRAPSEAAGRRVR